MMRADIPALSVARTMVALAQGFAAQNALFSVTYRSRCWSWA
jgi:hypothetical protein